MKRKVYRPPYKHNREKMEQLENCNCALEIGRGKEMNFSLVGIGGQDIYNGNETLTLGKWKQPLSPRGGYSRRSYSGRLRPKVRNLNFLDTIFERKENSFIYCNASVFTLTAIVWQQMRAYTLALLSKLTPDGTKIEDKDIINWVNNKVSYWR